jgi:hypothetical protein
MTIITSLIPGYEYDIFISYRQKDNKGDRWVSEFVEGNGQKYGDLFNVDVKLIRARGKETHLWAKTFE